MNRKQKFLEAVEILAPGDLFILTAAQHVREETIPAFPGAAALEFTVAMQRLKPAAPGESRSAKATKSDPGEKGDADCLSLDYALRVRSAEYWLQLGRADCALRELEALPQSAWHHPWAAQTRIAAVRALHTQDQFVVQE